MSSLILSGGGAKVPLHIGAIGALEELEITFDTYYGTSAGAIISGLLAMGKGYDYLYRLALKLDYEELLKTSILDIWNTIKGSHSVLDGNKFDKLYLNLFNDISFKDLEKECIIIGHCLNTASYEVFSKKTTPYMLLRDAVRISSSIPMLIKPVEYMGKLYVDGGLSLNFPVNLATDSYIGHLIKVTNIDTQYNNLVDYGLNLIDQMILANVETSIKNSSKMGKIIQSYYPIPVTQFKVSLEDKLKMLKIGHDNMYQGMLERV